MQTLILSAILIIVTFLTYDALNDNKSSNKRVVVEKSVPVVVSVIGDPCDDGKEETINDIYLSNRGLCVGLIERDEVTCKGDKMNTQSEALLEENLLKQYNTPRKLNNFL